MAYQRYYSNFLSPTYINQTKTGDANLRFGYINTVIAIATMLLMFYP